MNWKNYSLKDKSISTKSVSGIVTADSKARVRPWYTGSMISVKVKDLTIDAMHAIVRRLIQSEASLLYC